MAITIKHVYNKSTITLDLDTLVKADLRNIDLKDMDLKGFDLTGANLSGANLLGASLINCDISNANFENAYLCQTNMTNVKGRRVNFTNADLRQAYFYQANLSNCNFTDSNLELTHLDGCNLDCSIFTNANTINTNFTNASLKQTDFTQCDIEQAIFRGANITFAKLPYPVLCLYDYQWFISLMNDKIRIGCKCHTIEEWENFSSSEIARMEFDALDFWKVYKEGILTLAKSFVALNECRKNDKYKSKKRPLA